MIEIHLWSQVPGEADEAGRALEQDIFKARLTEEVHISKLPTVKGQSNIEVKGDPVTIGTVILTLVGAGGALTIAAGKGGVLSRLATVLEKYVCRGMHVAIKKPDGTEIQVKGSASKIAKVLSVAMGGASE